IERLTRENESLGEQVLAERRMEREVEKLRHELDNERSAMRNVLLPCPASTEVELVSTDLEIGVQVDPGPHRNCSRCGQPCNVEVCAACAREPLSSNPKVYECLGSDDCAVPCDVNMVALADYERLRAELDNERAAMRNVQECAESYRREAASWADRARKNAAQVERLSSELRKANAEIERLLAKLEGLHFHHKAFEPDCRHCREALRPADQQPPNVGQPDA
ncbi:MAG TPA: hypothetical protein VNH41_05140, partial [Steroidobacteraceae bacterium]|nr:hypothetical protein [Steroidobacteraceae bacterium]